jgi:hypothetical protein
MAAVHSLRIRLRRTQPDEPAVQLAGAGEVRQFHHDGPAGARGEQNRACRAHCLRGLPAQRRRQQARREREEQQIDQGQRHAPDLATGDAADQERQRGGRDDGEQRVAQEQELRGELAKHHVVATQVGEEQQAECALAFFFAEAVGGDEDAREQADDERVTGHHAEAGAARGAGHAHERHDCQLKQAQQQRHRRDREPDVARGFLPRALPQFTINNGEEGHGVMRDA